ncbi:MAG: hypothetical protein EWV49_17235 [Microcystis aeruginosa Ma_QC_Ch_20071001_S25]|uniref:Uncharacterized protein n=1 Tax=Microcystis aeruginosa Ma_QC_Ch_20071001_S25D TaxID=2486250 RepID=A0A552FRB7_MICAE|nr:MAG: hypothetical protein EWV68_20010 [Microcystis sp. M_QC_C_20170808_M9Col]TRT67807.1 MAG: hypothetical protein EWV67_03655 [Microcystis sp. M_QC_C_20170808_M2Col]TRU46300.1 MAG: hypothetical protein EWV49_17235 [Microcystis aeruginosa Ma_QC_Ch_20071001_S25]TRU49249.1 MAG: hypothetical protein EWV57_12640 [Microcystis aeruginosa Ma_QC_Ch_20071001_S25D]TRU67638.1 MAG: hypothetical protein EWV90_00215 [Microcystis aeruginosa Ma_QC_Ch_20071001_M135]
MLSKNSSFVKHTKELFSGKNQEFFPENVIQNTVFREQNNPGYTIYRVIGLFNTLDVVFSQKI